MAAKSCARLGHQPKLQVGVKIALSLLFWTISFNEVQAAALQALSPKAAPAPVTTPATAKPKVPTASPPAKAPVATPSPKISHSISPSTTTSAPSPLSPTSPAASPSIGPTTGRGNNTGGTVDPSQVLALQSLGMTVGADVCTSQPAQIGCDGGAPQHVTLLNLQYCAPTAPLSEAALTNLSTLTTLSFLDCPLSTVAWPPALAESLTAFTVTASLGRTTGHEDLQGLPGWWIGKLHNLHQLTVLEVLINASSIDVILSNMTSLTELTIQTTNLSGALPGNWSAANLTVLDLSNNKISGPLSPSLGKLTTLVRLDLGTNTLTGHIPSSIGQLANLNKLHLNNNKLTGPVPSSFVNLTSLVYLDLSNNDINGTIPSSLGNLPMLRYLDLSNNSLSGPLPFTPAFISQLNTFVPTGNAQLCYNASTLSAKLSMGLPPCDTNGLPVLVPASAPNGLGPASAPAGAASPQAGVVPAPPQHHGPKTVVWAAGIAVGVIVALIIIVIIVSKCFNSGKD